MPPRGYKMFRDWTEKGRLNGLNAKFCLPMLARDLKSGTAHQGMMHPKTESVPKFAACYSNHIRCNVRRSNSCNITSEYAVTLSSYTEL